MSKAFTKESDDAAVEALPPLPDPLPAGVVNYITAKGAEEKREELRHLLEDLKPNLVHAVSLAVKENRDTEEPAVSQKRQLRELEQRIDFLARRIQSNQVIDPSTQDQSRVFFGAQVTVSDEGGSEECYHIVGLDEADPEHDRISWISPLAKALRGAQIGNTVILELPIRTRHLTVKKIRYRG